MPLGLGYIAANLPRRYEVRLWDGVLNRDQGNVHVLDEIERFRPDVVGVSVWVFNSGSACDLVRRIKSRFSALPVVVGGPHVSGLGGATLSLMSADYGLAGDGEKSFRRLAEAMETDAVTAELLGSIGGLIYRQPDGAIATNAPLWDAIDDLNFPDYDLLRLKDYHAQGYGSGIHRDDKLTMAITTTRGCPFKCRFCGGLLVTGRKVRKRKVESVIAEIKQLHDRFGVRWFNVVDDNLTMDLGHAKQVCREILKLKLKDVSFASSNGLRLEFLDREVLALMKEAGWEYISIAPESGSPRTLERMSKHLKLDMVKEKMALIHAAGMKVCGFFMLGYPGETVDDIKLTIDFAAENDFDIVSYQFFQPLPGTPVYDDLVAAGEIERGETNFTVLDVPYAPVGMTRAELRRWFFWAHIRTTLLNPRRLAAVMPYVTLKRLWSFFSAVNPGSQSTRR